MSSSKCWLFCSGLNAIRSEPGPCFTMKTDFDFGILIIKIRPSYFIMGIPIPGWKDCLCIEMAPSTWKVDTWTVAVWALLADVLCEVFGGGLSAPSYPLFTPYSVWWHLAPVGRCTPPPVYCMFMLSLCNRPLHSAGSPRLCLPQLCILSVMPQFLRSGPADINKYTSRHPAHLSEAIDPKQLDHCCVFMVDLLHPKWVLSLELPVLMKLFWNTSSESVLWMLMSRCWCWLE